MMMRAVYLCRSLHALRIVVPVVGTVGVAHMAHVDLHRAQHEWHSGRWATAALFLAAAVADAFDVAVHLLLVLSLTVVHVDHHFIHRAEWFGMCAAVLGVLSMILGEILCIRTSTEERPKEHDADKIKAD